MILHYAVLCYVTPYCIVLYYIILPRITVHYLGRWRGRAKIRATECSRAAKHSRAAPSADKQALFRSRLAVTRRTVSLAVRRRSTLGVARRLVSLEVWRRSPLGVARRRCSVARHSVSLAARWRSVSLAARCRSLLLIKKSGVPYQSKPVSFAEFNVCQSSDLQIRASPSVQGSILGVQGL